MPHKRNPVASMTVLAAATRAPQRVAALLAAMPQAHERGLGDWQAELAEFQALLAEVHGALAALARAAPELRVDPARMRRNIDACGGLVFAEALATRLAAAVGKGEAHRRVEALCRDAVDRGVPLQDVAGPALAGEIAPDELAALFDPAVPARHAAAQARARLDALAAQAAALRRAAPWQDWLPQGD
jgi:3-carboxy-cis,cis-muconate cycloisomerase